MTRRLASTTRYRALIDTGATSTMVATRVVNEQRLQPTSILRYRSKDGESSVPGYLFRVMFYGDIVALPGDSEEDGVSRYDKMHVVPKVIEGGELSVQTGFDVLLGMDVLTTGTLTIRPDGTFTFTYPMGAASPA